MEAIEIVRKRGARRLENGALTNLDLTLGLGRRKSDQRLPWGGAAAGHGWSGGYLPLD